MTACTTEPPGTVVATSPCRVGIDLAEVAEVADSVERLGARFVSRVFTPQEQAACSGPAEIRYASLAARFAAKEAVVKVLEPSGVRPEWRSIEVLRLAHGACRLRLHGLASQMADEAGLEHWSVSLTHHGGLAAAVVAASGDRAAAWDRAVSALQPWPAGAAGHPLSPVASAPTGTPSNVHQGGEMEQEIRAVLAEYGRLPVDVVTLSVDDDLFQAGLTSHASVNVMLALEEAFNVEFPEAMLRKGTFESIASITEALEELNGVVVAR